jgi:outer membrane immunogenic protein
MRHIRIYLLTACAALGLASVQASAADLPRRVMPPPPPPSYMPSAIPAPSYAPLFSWTGFYAGANVGYGWGSGEGDIAINGVGSGPLSGDSTGFLGGVQAGYNWQLSAIVFGAEADLQYSTTKGDISGSPGASTLTAETRDPWFGTFRGRLGYASDRWLMYLTGGGVYGESKLSGTVSPGGGGGFDASQTYWSWTFGGGFETSMWDRWSIKLEYLYVGTPSDLPVPPRTAAINYDVTSHIVRTGLNYRF